MSFNNALVNMSELLSEFNRKFNNFSPNDKNPIML